MANKSKRRCDTLAVLRPDAAGIDVGASELYVAVSADRYRCLPVPQCLSFRVLAWALSREKDQRCEGALHQKPSRSKPCRDRPSHVRAVAAPRQRLLG